MECRIKDLDVHYEQVGEGRPVLMLHGWSLDHHHMMSRLEPVFKQRRGWKRIYLDLPGHGKTPSRPWITNLDGMLQVILDVIDRLIPGQKLSLVGASAGAYYARGVIHRRSASVQGLLMMVPMMVADDAKRHVPPRSVLVADPALVSTLDAQEAVSFGIAVTQTPEVADYMRAIVMPARKLADHAFLAAIGDDPTNYAFSFDVDALPVPCPAPTLIVTGRQDSICGYRDAWEILENYPRGTFAVLDRAGHMLPIEQEHLFHSLVGEWLDRAEEYADVSS